MAAAASIMRGSATGRGGCRGRVYVLAEYTAQHQTAADFAQALRQR